ncbi:hypothetical protein GCM10010399_22710 [Dactylosporangium fulvum]|uniref:Gamma-glutamyl-gamma-aminobutyrate hydrolase family protein n=1 Tax=Dactylosporangium fulvum TaxID=53359 RepID=A0ABY5WC35_9ACTN|nr:gamma-glutamyl-gamma-aminobutyrate hydrolase family protein [Dactylosporangium fulvum]UWP85661.1 gamma-glutamyl-gamma-aminobutyrate hydrolase family protein [Dactylosporangium fulvum]
MGLVVEVVCDTAEADAGFVGDRLSSHHGARLVFTSRDQLIEGRESAGDLLLLLGSERSVCDPEQAAVVTAESDLVRRSVASGIPVLGICYGAQLLAHALGGRVMPAEKPEVGWFGLDSVDEDLCPPVEWTQFHEYAFTPPDGACVLGESSNGCQAFSHEVAGTRVLGWQFHPEVSAERFARWVDSGRRTLDKTGASAGELVAAAPRREPVLRQAAHDLTDAAVKWLFPFSGIAGERDTNSALSRSIADMVDALEKRDVVGVALQFVDTSGIARIKTVPLRRLPQAAECGVSAPVSIEYFTPSDQVAPGPVPSATLGDVRLLPDLSRLVVLEAQPGWAWAPSDRIEVDGSPHFSCGRHLLRRMVRQLSQKGITALVAFEVEWMVSVGDSDNLVPPAGHTAYGMTSLISVSDYGRDLISALEAQGVSVEQFHPEFAAGQFEVSVRAEDPLNACDTSALVRATIRAVGQRHALRTTFAPKPDLDSLGNGGHLHLSLWRGERNLMAGNGRGLSNEAEAFAAGVLQRLRPLAALGAPSPASYLRLAPQAWAGAYGCWGWENREAAIRMVSGNASGDGRGANLELKCFDQMANPYLLLAGVLAAGTHGIDKALRLPEETRGDPAALTAEKRRELGIDQLPSSLDEATKTFDDDGLFRQRFGGDLVDQIVTVRRHDAEGFRSKTPAEIAAATRWVG